MRFRQPLPPTQSERRLASAKVLLDGRDSAAEHRVWSLAGAPVGFCEY